MTMTDMAETTDAAQLAGAGAPAPQRRRLGRIWSRLMRDSAYVLLGFPIALIAFVVLVTGVALGSGLLITLIGLPVLAGTLMIGRGFAALQRLRLRELDGRAAPTPRYRPNPTEGGWVRRVLSPVLDGQAWLDVAHAVLNFAVATLTWAIAFAWWVTSLAGLFYGAYDWALQIPRRDDGDKDLLELLGMQSTAPARIALCTAIGVVFALTLPLVLRACAAVQASLAQVMLVGTGELESRIETLTHTRTVLAGEQVQAMRRLERDIHDGPQQRLVRLSMDLSRAQRQLAADNREGARTTVQEALQQTRETLDELRSLSRGIAPPILLDRGLGPALQALADRCPVQVLLEVDLAGRPELDEATNSALYFVVSESLTNVAKHSAATRAAVTAAAGPPLHGRPSVLVRIGDDGTGGASLAKGHGLQGLADRVTGMGGVFTLDSPPGGPTLISAQLPCG